MSKVWPLPRVFRIRLAMLSDWHVRAKSEQQEILIDRLTRDSDGLPFIPSEILWSVWRQACFQLCWALDNGQPGRWVEWVDHLFGRRYQSTGVSCEPSDRFSSEAYLPAFRVGPAFMRWAVRCLFVEADPAFMDAITFIERLGAPSCTRRGCTRASQRARELARAGARLEAQCLFFTTTETVRQVASALLTASAPLVDSIETDELSARGRCRLELPGVNVNRARDVLERMPEPPPWIPLTSTITQGEADELPAVGSNAALARDDAEFVLNVQREYWRMRVCQVASRLGYDNGFRAEQLRWQRDLPNRAQSDALSERLAMLTCSERRTWVLEWLNNVRQDARRHVQWPIGAIEQLILLLSQPTIIWNWLESRQWPLLREKDRKILQSQLLAFAVRTLLETSLRAHRRSSHEILALT